MIEIYQVYILQNLKFKIQFDLKFKNIKNAETPKT